MKDTAGIVSVVIIVALVVAGVLVYLGQGRNFGEATRNEALVLQLAQSQEKVQAGETARTALTDELAQSQQEAQQAQAANDDLTEKIARALPRAELIRDVSEIGLAASQGKDTTREMFAWFGKMAALKDLSLNSIAAPAGRNPGNELAVMYLSGSIVDGLR